MIQRETAEELEARLAPASEIELAEVLKVLLAQYPNVRAENIDLRIDGYLMALRGYALPTLKEAVVRAIRGEIGQPGFMPLGSELSAWCRARERLDREALERYRRENLQLEACTPEEDASEAELRRRAAKVEAAKAKIVAAAAAMDMERASKRRPLQPLSDHQIAPAVQFIEADPGTPSEHDPAVESKADLDPGTLPSNLPSSYSRLARRDWTPRTPASVNDAVRSIRKRSAG